MIRLTLLCLLTAGGCARIEHFHVSEVMSHGNCQRIDPGATVVDYGTLAHLRGADLIGMSEAEPTPTEAPLTLIAVSLGTRPTPGYRLVLLDAGSLDGDVLTARVGIEGPPADAVLAQMLTHPCIVLGVADPGIRRIRIVDGDGALVGEVSPNR